MVGDAADPRFKPLIILQLISPTTSNFDPGEVVPMPTFPSMSITNLLLLALGVARSFESIVEIPIANCISPPA